jgi:hypothetical protein
MTETDADQQKLDLYREMNRYDEREEDWPSSAVFEHPRRTLANKWRKFHAARDCGSSNVRFVEKTTSRPVSEKYEYGLRCSNCAYDVPEDEVLFVGGDWFSEHGWREYGRPVEDLRIPEARVLELGADPERSALERVLRLGGIERAASAHGLSFGSERYHECVDCERETMLVFDDRCRMCYDGEWTTRMQEIVDGAGIQVRERNNSFKHRVESQVDPLSIKNRAFEEKILWRRHDAEGTSKLVEVTQCLRDDADGHWEYVLQDPTHTRRWQYRQEDLAACFWDTGLYNDAHAKPIQDDRIREVYQRVCDHTYSEVLDSETGDVVLDRCTHCRHEREVSR